MLELGFEGMFAGKDDWGLGVGWGFEAWNGGVVDLFGLGDRPVFGLEAGANSSNIGLNPNGGSAIAGWAQNATHFFAFSLCADGAFDHDVLLGFSNLLDEHKSDFVG